MDFVVYGAGGLGKEVVWAWSRGKQEHRCIGFCDDDPSKKGQKLYGLPIIGGLEDVIAEQDGHPAGLICAIGRNDHRERCVGRALGMGFQPITIVDPSVILADDVQLGEGTFVSVGSLLAPTCQVGNHVIINTMVSVGHDSVTEDFAQLSPGARISGNARLRKGCLVASNGVVAPGVEVGEFAVVGAASFALRKVPAGQTVLGNPAKPIYTARR